MLAKRGFTGPVRVVESEAGVRAVVARGEMDLARLTDFSGWRILNGRFKAMPTNATTAAHVFATLALVEEHDLKPEDIAAVHIRASVREARHTTTPAKKYPRNAESADHSAFYANALAIKERAFGPSSIEPEKFTDPVVLCLIEKMTVTGDATFTHYQGAAEIVTRDGRRLHKRVDVPHGVGNDPLSDAELETKFRELASPYMSEAQASVLVEACWRTETLEDVGQLAKLMVFDAACRQRTGGAL
jgi:2-methylcitrate dehydratase